MNRSCEPGKGKDSSVLSKANEILCDSSSNNVVVVKKL